MAAIANAFASQGTEQTTTSSTYAAVSGARIASGDLVNGGVYLLLVRADVSINGTANRVGCRVVHGSTAWADSEQDYESQGASVRIPYFWFHVFTQASSENIDVQLRSVDNTTTARIDNIAMQAIRLDVDLTADVDYRFAELGTDNALGTSFEDGASTTWTPANSGDTWLVIGYQQVSMSGTTSQGEMQMVISGGATYTGGLNSIEGENTSNLFGHWFARGLTLTNSSTTLKVQGRSESSNVFTHLHSKVFALRLNVFKNFIQGYTDGELAGTTSAFADAIETETMTPDDAGDVFAIACCITDYEATGVASHHRLQLDNADVITYTDHNLNGNVNDATDQLAWLMFSRNNVTAASHTWDHDGYVSAATAGRGYLNRSMVVFSMELAAGGGGAAVSPYYANYYVPMVAA